MVADATVRARTDSVTEVGGGFGSWVGAGRGVMGWGPFRPRVFGVIGATVVGMGRTPHTSSKLSGGESCALRAPCEANCKQI